MTLLKITFTSGLLEWCNISPSAEHNLSSGSSANEGGNKRTDNYLDDAKCKRSFLLFNLLHPFHYFIFTPHQEGGGGVIESKFLDLLAENVKTCETGGLKDSWRGELPLTFLTAWSHGQKMIIS